MAMVNLEQWGISKLGFATIGEGGVYDAIHMMPGAKSLNETPNDNNGNRDAADNGEYYNGSGASTKTGELQVVRFDDWFRQNILGQVSEGGGIGEGDGAKRRFAMLYEIDGDQGGQRVVWYDCIASDISRTLTTTDVDGNVTFAAETSTITAKLTTLPNGNRRRSWFCEKGTPNFDSFFNEVYFPAADDGGEGGETTEP